MKVTLRRLAPGSLIAGLIWLSVSAPLSCANSTQPPPPPDAGQHHHHKEAGPMMDRMKACGAIDEQCCPPAGPGQAASCDPGAYCSPVDGHCKDQHPSDIGKPCFSNEQCSGLVCGYTQGLSTDGSMVTVPDGNGTPPPQPTGCTVLCAVPDDCMPGWTCQQVTVGLGTCVCNWAPETCDGKDNNCDGIIDNEPEVDNFCTLMDDGIPQKCVKGSCVCVNECASQCVDVNNDDMNCGKCGNACKAMVEKCQEGKCGCAYTMCGGECVNTGGNDAANCGDCGKVCDFTCTDGQCGPVTLTSGLNSGNAIAVDSTNVYFLDRSTSFQEQLQYCPITGCGVTPGTLATASASGYGSTSESEYIAVTPSRVYFADFSNSIEETPIKGGSGTGSIFGTGAGTEPAVAVDGVNVYWANRTSKNIHSCPIGASCGTPTLIANTSTQGDPVAIAVSGANVYFVARTSYVYPPTVAVYSAPISGAGPVSTVCTIASVGYSYSATSSLVAAGSSLYVNSGTSILTCPLSGGGSAAATFYTDTNDVFMMATDGISLYFVDGASLYGSATENINKCALGASCKTATSVLTGTGRVLALAVGADALYWIGEDKVSYSYTQSVLKYAK